MDRIIEAIHSSVPEELWPEILRKIDGPVAADTPADEFEDCDDAEDEYDPVESALGRPGLTGLRRTEILTTHRVPQAPILPFAFRWGPTSKELRRKSTWLPDCCCQRG